MRHGNWWNRMQDAPVDELMEGRFTRLFHVQGAGWPDADLHKLAEAMTSDPDEPPTPETADDPEENPAIDAVYTYFGQFIDHDITFDPTSQLRQFITSKEQLRALVDFRTPHLDLDNLYGQGPDDQPYMYAADGIHMALGDPMSGNPDDPGTVQVPRGPNGRALIGDPRNDENRIVSQLHSTMLRFHNVVADRMLGANPATSFDDVRQAVRWHYQWVLVTDFLRTVIQADTYAGIFADPYNPTPSIPALKAGLDLMPVEFSVAAYRFGHSMIRPIYRINPTIERRQIFSLHPEEPAADLGGFRPIPSDWGIDWQSFIDLTHGAAGTPPTSPDDPVVRQPQRSYKIDTSLVNPLGALPPAVATNPSSLALRNLERGATFELPSGQAVARALGMMPMPDDKIIIGKATGDPSDPQQPITSLSSSFAGKCPLWTYVLSEAHQTSWAAADPAIDKAKIGIQLGPVGGTLVGEVLAAILIGDPTSYLNAPARFTPDPAFSRGTTFGLAELINVALGRTP